MELSNAKYGNISAPVPIVTKVGVGDAISNNLSSLHEEYEDDSPRKSTPVIVEDLL